MHPVLSSLGRLAAGAILAAPLGATDHFVDVLHGSDSNGGTSPADAWRTITHAITTGGAERIVLGPGTYSVSSGESFPLYPGGVLILGERGSDATILDGESVAGTLVDSRWANLEGLTLRRAGTGLDFFTPDQTQTHLTDVVIEWMTGYGFHGLVYTPGQYDSGSLASTMTRVRIRNCGAGVYLDNWAFSGLGPVSASGCEFSDNAGTGFEIVCSGAHFTASLVLDHCKVVRNAGNGVVANAGYNSGSSVLDSLVAENGGNGILANAPFAAARRSTIVSNAGTGLSVVASMFGALAQGCILYGNGDDLAYPSWAVVEYCDIGDGDLAGTSGNISASPRFMDAAAGDYRLRFGSPCIDSSNPTGVGTTDLAGHARGVDGNLDTVGAADMGAYELRTLDWNGRPRLGATVELELWGPRGAPCDVYASRLELATTPTSTPLGDLWLPRSSTIWIAQAASDIGPGGVLPIALPSSPIWIGRTLSFQALVTTGVGAGQAYTNPVDFVLGP